MSILKLPREQVAALRAEDLQSYLVSRGWQPDEAASSDLATVYRLAQEPDAEILVPKRRDLGDYTLRMADAAMTLSAVESRSVWEVMNDLASPPSDVVRLRVQSPEAAAGTIDLEEGLHLIQGGRDLLLAAACSAHQPQAYYPRQSFALANEFLRNCRLAQTEQGSFVARIITPVPPTITPSLFPQDSENEIPVDEPYERRVTLYLMAGLRAVATAIAAGRPEQILQGVQQGVSANLCDALVTMTPSSPQASLEICLGWSRARPPVQDRFRGPVTFLQGQFAVIREAARRLREGVLPRRERITGTVTHLQAEPPQLLTPFEGRVTVRAEVEGRASRVRFVLSEGEYALACNAHRDRRRVAVTGVLQRDARSRMFGLLQPRDFQILQDVPASS